MKEKDIKSYLEIGETIAVEFKRCGNRIENLTLNKLFGDV